ncbi:MAG: hypothetical protein LC797_25615, partial [Chloroflexi bacterium]|nr:hypothetical protein [Chloroflexota bacterium]
MVRRVSPLAVVAMVPMTVLVVLVAGLIWISIQQGIIGTTAAHYTLDNYSALFVDGTLPGVLLNTALFALCATTTALGIGLPVAWLVERSNIAAKAAVYALMSTGLLIPGIYVAMG